MAALFSIRGSASPEIDLQLLFGLSYSDKTADFKDKGRSISAVQTVSDYNGWNWYLIQPSSTFIILLKTTSGFRLY